jgi:hypothetical protein
MSRLEQRVARIYLINVQTAHLGMYVFVNDSLSSNDHPQSRSEHRELLPANKAKACFLISLGVPKTVFSKATEGSAVIYSS